MSYDLERAVEHAIEQLQGISQARHREGDEWIAKRLSEIADELARPLAVIEQTRQRERERALRLRRT